jgi:hypothetical protein
LNGISSMAFLFPRKSSSKWKVSSFPLFESSKFRRSFPVFVFYQYLFIYWWTAFIHAQFPMDSIIQNDLIGSAKKGISKEANTPLLSKK